VIVFKVSKGHFTEASYRAQAALKLEILLSQLPEYWDYRCAPQYLAALFFLSDSASTT
jgi:hypothetical protein